MPLEMWAATGAVPQWYMNTPGTRGTKRNWMLSLGITFRYARSGAISAAWKSMECGMFAPFTSVNSMVSPTVARMIGPGTMESKVHAS